MTEKVPFLAFTRAPGTKRPKKEQVGRGQERNEEKLVISMNISLFTVGRVWAECGLDNPKHPSISLLLDQVLIRKEIN